MAIIVNIKYCKLVKVYPFAKYKGIEMMSPTIQNIQFSIFLFAISHIPTKKIPVMNVSKYDIQLVNLLKNK